MPSALARHTDKFYTALEAEATRQKINGEVKLVFTGHYSKLFRRVVGNPSYYTPMRKVLIETGSIEVLQKGNASIPTIVVLNHKPPSEKSFPDDLTGAGFSARMKVEFERRLAGLEAWRENLTGGGANIPQILQDFEGRIATLEKEVASLKTARKGKVTNG